MKRIIAILLILLLLAGCARQEVPAPTEPAPTTQPTEPPTEPPAPAGLVEMNIDEVYLQCAYSLTSQGDTVMFLADLWEDSTGTPTVPAGEEMPETLTYTTRLLVYNAKEQKLLSNLRVENCPLDGIWGCEFGENGTVILYNDNDHQNAVYDENMSLLEVTDRPEFDPWTEAQTSPFYSEGRSTVNPGYVRYEGDRNDLCVYFTDEPETLYIRPFETYTYTCAFREQEKLVMTETDLHDSAEAHLAIEDLKAARRVNSARLDAAAMGYEYASCGNYTLGDTYAAIICSYYNMDDSDNYSTTRAYFWNYRLEAENTPIQVEVYDIHRLNEENQAAIEQIRADYNVDIHVNECHDYIEGMVDCSGDAAPVALRDNLAVIRAFLDSLPEGMVTEIYSGMENEYLNAQGIRLDIVSEITYDASAFAQSYADPMEVCFSFNSVSSVNVAHEFMHLMDVRLDDHISASEDYDFGLYDEWAVLNEGFEAAEEDSETQYDYDETNFISYYATTNNTEDRAEMFSILYANADYGVHQLEQPGVRRKAETLCRLIRESFPSCAEGELVWEKALG